MVLHNFTRSRGVLTRALLFLSERTLPNQMLKSYSGKFPGRILRFAIYTTPYMKGGEFMKKEIAMLFSKETSEHWTDDKDQNLLFLKTCERYFNNKLMLESYVSLDDVTSTLGLETSIEIINKAMQKFANGEDPYRNEGFGWSKSDGQYIDFNLFENAKTIDNNEFIITLKFEE